MGFGGAGFQAQTSVLELIFLTYSETFDQWLYNLLYERDGGRTKREGRA